MCKRIVLVLGLLWAGQSYAQGQGQPNKAFLHGLAERQLLSPDNPRDAIYRRPLTLSNTEMLGGLSKDNIRRSLRRLGVLSPAEKAIFKRVRALEPTVTLRMSNDRLHSSLELGGVPSPASLARISVLESRPFSMPPQWPQPYTPGVEEQLFGAHAFVFATFSSARWAGLPDYGAVLLQLDPKMLSRTWASRRSGWSVIKEVAQERNATLTYDSVDKGTLQAARQRFAHEAFSPRDYRTIMAVEVLEFLRKSDPKLTTKFLNTKVAQLPRLLDQHKLGFLELKVPNHVPLAEVRRARLPHDVDREVVQALRARRIPYTVASRPR